MDPSREVEEASSSECRSDVSKSSSYASFLSYSSSHLSVDITSLEIGPGYFRRTPSPQRRSPNPRSQKMRRSAWKLSSDPESISSGQVKIMNNVARRDHPCSLVSSAQDAVPYPSLHNTQITQLSEKQVTSFFLVETEKDSSRKGRAPFVEATRTRRNPTIRSICGSIEDLSLGHGDPFG